jgi:hypothetical protein
LLVLTINFSVNHTASLKAGVDYTITPCLQTPGQNCKVNIEVSGPDVQSLTAIRGNTFIKLNSTWKPGLDGGYKSTTNPQFELFYGNNTPSQFMVTLTRKDKKSDVGMMFMILKSIRRITRRKKFEESDKINESRYLLSSKVDSTFVLPGEGSYLIVPCLQPGLTVSFELSVESSSDKFTFTELGLEKSVKNENNCSEVLKKYKGSVDNGGSKIVYYDANPVDDIVAYCKQKGTMFVDSQFAPNENSVNWDDGRKKVLYIFHIFVTN